MKLETIDLFRQNDNIVYWVDLPKHLKDDVIKACMEGTVVSVEETESYCLIIPKPPKANVTGL